jgi:hypothetical protein
MSFQQNKNKSPEDVARIALANSLSVYKTLAYALQSNQQIHDRNIAGQKPFCNSETGELFPQYACILQKSERAVSEYKTKVANALQNLCDNQVAYSNVMAFPSM